MDNSNKLVFKRTAMYSTILTAIFLAIVTLAQEFGIKYIQNKDFPLTNEAKALSDVISEDKVMYIGNVVEQILYMDKNIETVLVCKFEPDRVLPKEINRIFLLKNKKHSQDEFLHKFGISIVKPINEIPGIYFKLLSESKFKVTSKTDGVLGIVGSTIEDDENHIFGMYSYNSPSGWVGVITKSDYTLPPETIRQIEALTYRINVILF